MQVTAEKWLKTSFKISQKYFILINKNKQTTNKQTNKQTVKSNSTYVGYPSL